MYKSILIPVDNSKYSNLGVKLGAQVARKFGSKIIGIHVMNPELHGASFKKLESGLPEEYQTKERLRKQGKIHNDLIRKGLKLISESYLDAFENLVGKNGLVIDREVLEGRNFEEIVRYADSNDCDLVVIGYRGLGETGSSTIGSTCTRVIRTMKKDVLIVKNNSAIKDGKILIAIDGSPNSYEALDKAITLSREFDAKLEAIHVYDPFFHNIVFHKLKEVLSEEAGKVFKFEEQERLHEVIINKGLRKVGERHLEAAKRIAGERGVELTMTMFEGKPFERISEYVTRTTPALLVVGRYGRHQCPSTDLGSDAENLVRLAECNIFVVSRSGEEPLKVLNYAEIPEDVGKEDGFPWTEEAKKRLEKVPSFAREMAKKAIESYAQEKGYSKVTPEVMSEARSKMGM